MLYANREEIIAMTPFWQGERMADGRPRVSEDILERMRHLTLEEVWEFAWAEGYNNQVVMGLRNTRPGGAHLVGRAVTCICMPHRADVDAVCRKVADAYGLESGYNKSLIGKLVEDDVLVVDLFDKVEKGTFVGGNLSTAIATNTKRGGAIIWGAIRDADQIREIENLQIYHRGIHPTGLRDYMMTGVNQPTRIGTAVCMPGDVVYGGSDGVCFIPAHLAEETVIRAERSKVRDIFAFRRLREGVYTPSQMDSAFTEPIWQDLLQFVQNDAEVAQFQYLYPHFVKAYEAFKKQEEEGRSAL